MAVDMFGVPCLPSHSMPGASWPSDGGQHVPLRCGFGKAARMGEGVHWESLSCKLEFKSKDFHKHSFSNPWFSHLQSDGINWDLSKFHPAGTSRHFLHFPHYREEKLRPKSRGLFRANPGGGGSRASALAISAPLKPCSDVLPLLPCHLVPACLFFSFPSACVPHLPDLEIQPP